MNPTKKTVEWKNSSGQPVTAAGYTLTPQSQALVVRTPFLGWVWNRPVAVLVESEGVSQRIPVVDVTRLVAVVSDEPPERPLTEADWNETSSLQRNAYYYSKVLAEREAWRFLEAERPGFDLVSINPASVVGPSLVPPLNTSNKILADLLSGGFPAIVALAWAFVDVRDVAFAHVAALERPEARGRHLCANLTLSLRELAERVRRLLPGERVPSLGVEGPVGRLFSRAFSLTLPRPLEVRIAPREHLGHVWLPWEKAADKCFSWSNAQAIRTLRQRPG